MTTTCICGNTFLFPFNLNNPIGQYNFRPYAASLAYSNSDNPNAPSQYFPYCFYCEKIYIKYKLGGSQYLSDKIEHIKLMIQYEKNIKEIEEQKHIIKDQKKELDIKISNINEIEVLKKKIIDNEENKLIELQKSKEQISSDLYKEIQQNITNIKIINNDNKKIKELENKLIQLQNYEEQVSNQIIDINEKTINELKLRYNIELQNKNKEIEKSKNNNHLINTTSITEIGLLLIESGLDKYIEIFNQHGYDDLAEINWLSFDKLHNDWKIPEGHALKCMRILNNKINTPAYINLVEPSKFSL
jgi:hypothetical protein